MFHVDLWTSKGVTIVEIMQIYVIIRSKNKRTQL